MARGSHHAHFRAHWVYRRLQQGGEKKESRPDWKTEIFPADYRELRRRHCSALSYGERHVLHATERSIFQEFSSGPGHSFASLDALLVVLLYSILNICCISYRRVFQRGESHRWPGRARDWVRGGRGGGAHGFNVCDQLRAV